MENPNAPYRRGDDPFFGLSGDRQWNACIGRQGTEENYVDGYIEAARELASAIIEKRMYAKRDTLVMPILYNARHALELSLKFAINELYEMGILKNAHPKNHDILSHWALLQAGELGDEALRHYVTALERYVTSLSEIDDDGQELRYSENRDGQKSLADRSLANIEVIRASLDGLSEVMTQLKYRLLDLAYERATGSYTAQCSRRDLLEIARILPERSNWRDPAFAGAKAEAMRRFSLSCRQFSKAVNVIESNREMRCLIGLETNLAHLSDQNALFAVEQWARLHPVRTIDDRLGIVNFADLDRGKFLYYLRIEHEVNHNIQEVLTKEEIADLEVIYYTGRNNEFCEHYEKKIESTKKEHLTTGDLMKEVDHLMSKTNFQVALARGVSTLGRPDIADKLLAIERPVAHES